MTSDDPSQAVDMLPATFGAASLFIDGYTYRSGELKPVNSNITITRNV